MECVVMKKPKLKKVTLVLDQDILSGLKEAAKHYKCSIGSLISITIRAILNTGGRVKK